MKQYNDPPQLKCVDCGADTEGTRRCTSCQKAHIQKYIKEGGDYCKTAHDTFHDHTTGKD